MSLPFVLAGPIVRRSTSSEVNVWLATSRDLDEPRLLLYESKSHREIPTGPTSGFKSVRLAKQLFVHLVTARTSPDTPFPTTAAIEYDIEAGGSTLENMMTLKDIVLPGFRLPSLVLQEEGAPSLHAIYGSCRKSHGPSPDLMRAAQQLMKLTRDGRPEVLFLGGDQIYADDVDTKMIVHYNIMAAELTQHFERVPSLPLPAHSPFTNRGAFLKKAFTSGEMAHHLLTFGEYAATYLFAWNHEFFSRTTPRGTGPGDSVSGARATRLVLANIVTYMIFDDHEITDDWNLNDGWARKVNNQAWAKGIVSNGLTAYWAFQGWGNDPDDFDADFLDQVEASAFRQERQEEAALSLQVQGWSYVAPTWPRTVVLNTRTGRSMSRNIVDKRQKRPTNKDGPLYQKYGYEPPPVKVRRDPAAPRLLGEHQRKRIAELIDNEVISGEPLIVIAPAPVLGFRPIEEMQELIGAFSPEMGDFESWAANPRNLLDLVELLWRCNPKFVVILSGDVHYAFEIAASISNGARTLPVAQFCSSALKNRPTGALKQGAEWLRHKHVIDDPVAWWDLGGGEDGPVARAFATNSFTYEGLVRLHGKPTFVSKENLNEREGERVHLVNNIGEFKIDTTGVSHRFWRFDLGSGRADEFVDWLVDTWPAPRVWL